MQALVSRYGLKRAGSRASLADYTRELWQRRYFIAEFSRATNASGYSSSMLGQYWQVLTPLLNAGVYYVMFGLILGTSRHVHNYTGFLVVGVFVFQFIQTSINSGSRALQSYKSLARTLRFPRAVFPLASTSIALEQLLASLVVLVPIILLTGESIRVQWIEVVPALALVTMFGTGMAFIFARIGSKVPDVSQMLPFVLRVWFYFSGIMYSIQQFTKNRPAWVGETMSNNPATIYVNLFRSAFLGGYGQPLTVWLAGLAWSVVVLAAGYVYFWKAEEDYGRD
ncbi:ABC transporter permease [Flexivirga caeni]|uniref:Transport permease protein n=1 Tax=Flexivirga caeni TaxID=2294115 RepID=A0A3M9M674_9MICO|nr:ABC transporter permease [Flexivirga caeni]